MSDTIIRLDHQAFATRINTGSCILDVGCGDGALMAYLEASRQVDARGLEITEDGVGKCLARGLSVIQGDAETDLSFFPDDGFDYAILSRTLEALKSPKTVLEQLARIAPDILLSFHNQGHWTRRLGAGFGGRIPKVEGAKWYEADRLHLVSLLDVVDLATSLNLKPVAFAAVSDTEIRSFKSHLGLLNLTATEVILHLRRA